MRSAIILFLLLFFISCATSPPPEPSVENNILTIYLAKNFHPKMLETGGIAVLPVPAKNAPEGIRNNAIFEIQQALQIYFPKVRIVKKDDMVKRIRDAGMDREFNLFIKNLSENKTVDRLLLMKIGDVGGVRFLLYTEVKIYEKNSTNAQVIKDVEMEAGILDVNCKDMVWKGAGGTRVVEDKDIDKIRMEEIFINATKNLISSMPAMDKMEDKGEVKGCA